MDLGQDQQQHPAVHNGGVSRGRVRGCGRWPGGYIENAQETAIRQDTDGIAELTCTTKAVGKQKYKSENTPEAEISTKSKAPRAPHQKNKDKTAEKRNKSGVGQAMAWKFIWIYMN